ncbi:MAG: element excision factor XisH family protein [Coleofasciculus sp. C1-SOL-03]|uniref:element excision factor XisH family protein n=1 Tax=Coleofasciculus sp. C1-SOL-03 TaxID=3069522 RepID=UPI0032FEDDDA
MTYHNPNRVRWNLLLQWSLISCEVGFNLESNSVPVDVFQTFFQYEFTQFAVQRYQVLIIVYDPVNEVIVRWTR